MNDPNKEKKILERAEKYRAYLYIHGVLTEAENEKVRIRIQIKYMKCIEETERLRPSNNM